MIAGVLGLTSTKAFALELKPYIYQKTKPKTIGINQEFQDGLVDQRLSNKLQKKSNWIKVSALMIAGVLGLTSTKAFALEFKPYIRIGVGQDFNRVLEHKWTGDGFIPLFRTYDNPDNTTLNLAYGISFQPNLRVAFEITRGLQGTKSVILRDEVGSWDEDIKLASTSFMLQGYYDLANFAYAGFTPLLGMGFGSKSINLKHSVHYPATDYDDGYYFDEKFSSRAFAYELILGLSYRVKVNWAVDLSYSYSSAKFKETTKLKDDGFVETWSLTNPLTTNSMKLALR
jgi:opacity protein-like surface antigen